MTAALLLAALAVAGGTTLVLADLPWFRRPSLAERLRPFTPGGGPHRRSPLPDVGSFRDVVVPVCRQLGDRLAGAFGVQEELGRRLERLHLDIDPNRFRARQAAWSVAGAAMGAVLGAGLGPTGVGILAVPAGALLAFLLTEQRLATLSARHQESLRLELPVVAEQLGILLGAGYSVGASLDRLAARGAGTCSRDLARVVRRIRQGLDERDALREWADVADVPALHRLVRVLALDREATDLSRLVSAEARAMRREAHRRLVEAIERRSQQVWIPVTVAALVPGALFLAVPFVDALSLIAGT